MRSAVVVSGAMLVWPLFAGARGGARVSTLQATQMINHKDATVIDIREQAEYSRGHIANAKGTNLNAFGTPRVGGSL